MCTKEIGEVAAKLIVLLVVMPFVRRVLDSAVHPLDLAVGPGIVRFGQLGGIDPKLPA